MARLNLPAGAVAAFRLDLADEFGGRLTVHVYGARRGGWLLAHDTGYLGPPCAVGPWPLMRGQWRQLLGLVKRADFWNLPEWWPAHPSLLFGGFESIGLAGQDGERYHHAWHWHGDTYAGRGLHDVARFVTQLSGLAPVPRPAAFASDVPAAGAEGAGVVGGDPGLSPAGP